MNKTVIDKIIDSELITEGASVIVGFSGGPDSLCLLDALVQLSDAYNLNIVPVHVDHQLREASYQESLNAVRMCERYGLECEVYKADCGEMAQDYKVSTEEAGRIIRYQIFDEVAAYLEEEGIPANRIVIAVAHNADDQSETVLFRLLRGTGIRGLAGIPPVRPSESGYMIVRPLLGVTRAEIEAYISENKLHPNMDESNLENDYTRNRIRNELIPYLEKNYNPNIKGALRKFAEISETDDSFLTELAYEVCAENLEGNDEEDAVILDVTEIKDIPPAIISRVVTIIFSALRIDSLASNNLIVSVMQLIYSEKPSASIDLPAGYRAFREYDRVVFTNNPELYISTADENARLMPQVIMAKDFKPLEEDAYAAFDFDKFNEIYPGKVGEIKLRTRREGDWIAIRGGSKKIQDLFVDIKVKKNARDSLLMACIGSEVLWILPNENLPVEEQRKKGRFSQNFHIDDASERVLFLEVIDQLW